MKAEIPGRLRGLFFVLLFFLPVLLSAHPHMQFNSTAEFVWEGKKLAGVFLEWQFDSFFSADIIRAYDVNADGSFDEAETRAVFEGAFSNLRHYYFFTFIRQGDRRETPASVEKFSAFQRNGTLVYRFYVDLRSWNAGTLHLAVYDYTFFCDIRYPDGNPVTLRYDREQVLPRWEIRENRNNPVYYNPLGDIEDTTVYYEWKPGLETYYPREITIYHE